jgi:hypothetical protein
VNSKSIAPLFVVVVVALIGCNSPEQAKVQEMNASYSQGFIQSSHDKAIAIVENPTEFSTQQLAKAQEILTKTRQQLVRHHVTNIQRHLLAEDPHRAVGIFEEAQVDFPELLSEAILLRRMMRGYARIDDLPKAREIANLLLAANPSPGESRDAERFLNDLDDLEEARSVVENLKPRVAAVEAVSKMEFTGINSAPTCVMMRTVEDFDKDTQQMIVTYMDTVMKETALTARLGRMPAVVN